MKNGLFLQTMVIFCLQEDKSKNCIQESAVGSINRLAVLVLQKVSMIRTMAVLFCILFIFTRKRARAFKKQEFNLLFGLPTVGKLCNNGH